MKKLHLLILLAIILASANFSTGSDAGQLTYVELGQISVGKDLFSVAWHPDGSLIMASGEDGVYLFTPEIEQIAHLQFETNPATVSSVWSPDGQKAASLLYNGMVYIWTPLDETVLDTWRSHKIFPKSIAWSDDGSKIAVGSIDGTVTIYDIERKQQLDLLTEEYGSITFVTWHPNNQWLIFGARPHPEIIIWDIEGDKKVREIRSDRSHYLMGLSPDGHMMAVGGLIPEDRDVPAQAVLYIWPTDALSPVRSIFIAEQGELEFYTLAWHPDNVLLAAYNHDEQIRIWDSSSGQLIVQMTTVRKIGQGDVPSYNSLDWSPDGTKLADVGTGGSLRIWVSAENTESIDS